VGSDFGDWVEVIAAEKNAKIDKLLLVSCSL
jgi:hypothetical protein